MVLERIFGAVFCLIGQSSDLEPTYPMSFLS